MEKEKVERIERQFDIIVCEPLFGLNKNANDIPFSIFRLKLFA